LRQGKCRGFDADVFRAVVGKEFWANLDSERGKFRAFLLAALKHFLANEWDKAQTQKRGGGAAHLSLDWQRADTKFQVAATSEPSPDKAFVPIYGHAGVGHAGTDGQPIRVVDLAKRAVVGTIDLGTGVRPHCAVMWPKNSLLYVTTEISNCVTVIDPQTLQVVGRIPTGEPESHMLAITRDGRHGCTANVASDTAFLAHMVWWRRRQKLFSKAASSCVKIIFSVTSCGFCF
jgi:YVTN family beta-propeller protein